MKQWQEVSRVPETLARLTATAYDGVWARRLALATLVVFLVTAFRTGWTRETTDFPNYYTAAVAARAGQPLRDYYDWTWFARQMSHAGYEYRVGAYAAQTPLTMVPMLAIAGLPPQRAKQVWISVNLALLATVVWLLSRVTRFRVEQIWLVLFAGYFSLASNFVLGQYYVLLLWLLTLAFYCMHRNRAVTAGLLAGSACALKLYGGPLVLLFAARRNWRAVAGMLAAVVACGAVAVALFGAADVGYYLTQVLPRSLEGSSIDPYHAGSPTVSSFLHRVLLREPELNPAPLWHAPGLFFFLRTATSLAVVSFTVVGLTLNGRRNDRRDFAWVLIALMLLTTSVGLYSFFLLALPVVLLMEDAGTRARVLLIAAWVLLTVPLGPVALFPKLWLLLALYVVVGLDYWRAIRPRVLLATAVGVVLVATADAARRVASWREEPAQRFERLVVEHGSTFASSPAVSDSGVFYQAMGRDRYVLKRLRGRRVDTLTFDGQAVQPIAISAAGPIQFELVAHQQSATMHLDPVTLRAVPAPAGTPVVRADSIVSPDGKWVAWVSTAAGPQHIWLRRVASGKAHELTGGNCNSALPAWEPDSDAIIFASDCGRALGMPALYRARVVGSAR